MNFYYFCNYHNVLCPYLGIRFLAMTQSSLYWNLLRMFRRLLSNRLVMRNSSYDVYFQFLIFWLGHCWRENGCDPDKRPKWSGASKPDQKVGPLSGTFGPTAISKFSWVTPTLKLFTRGRGPKKEPKFGMTIIKRKILSLFVNVHKNSKQKDALFSLHSNAIHCTVWNVICHAYWFKILLFCFEYSPYVGTYSKEHIILNIFSDNTMKPLKYFYW